MDDLKDIIAQFKQRDYRSFDAFYAETKKSVYFTIRSILGDPDLSEDIMQETYMAFLQKIDLVDSERNVRSYLLTIARNLSIDLYNKRKREVLSDEFIDSIPSEETRDDPEVLEILKLLGEAEREVITQRIINDLKFKEIARITNKPLGTVLWLYHKGIRTLREKVGDDFK
ncbi:MAG: RNA polymerase sigma factor [Acholeplasmataceae bacterium]